MQIIRFVKSLVLGGIFFSMLLSIATVNDKMHVNQYETLKAGKSVTTILHEIEPLDIVMQNPIKVATCVLFAEKEQNVITPSPKTDMVQKPKSHTFFSIFNPPKFS